MQVFKIAVVTLVVLALVNPTEAWRGRRLRKAFKRIKESAKKRTCKFIFGIGCKVAVDAAGAVVAAKTGGIGTAGAIVGGAIAKNKCHARRKKCKRSVVSDEILLPFSDDFRDYDSNEDDLISYEEFVFAVMLSVPMADPSELKVPFMSADTDDDDHLDFEEFEAAPFLFAHVEKDGQGFNSTSPTSTVIPEVEISAGLIAQTQSQPTNSTL